MLREYHLTESEYHHLRRQGVLSIDKPIVVDESKAAVVIAPKLFPLKDIQSMSLKQLRAILHQVVDVVDSACTDSTKTKRLEKTLASVKRTSQ